MTSVFWQQLISALLSVALALGSAGGGSDQKPADGGMSSAAEASLGLLHQDMAYSDQIAGAVAYLGYREPGDTIPLSNWMQDTCSGLTTAMPFLLEIPEERILGAGYNHRIGGAVAEAGIGVRIPCTRWLDLRQEVTASSLYDAEGQAAWGADYLFAPAFRIGRHLALTVGAGIGYQSFYPTHQPVASPFPLWQGDDGRQVSLNLQAGVEYVF